jgi:hypothetical protein
LYRQQEARGKFYSNHPFRIDDIRLSSARIAPLKLKGGSRTSVRNGTDRAAIEGASAHPQNRPDTGPADTSQGSVPDDQWHMDKKTPGIMPGTCVVSCSLVQTNLSKSMSYEDPSAPRYTR